MEKVLRSIQAALKACLARSWQNRRRRRANEGGHLPREEGVDRMTIASLATRGA